MRVAKAWTGRDAGGGRTPPPSTCGLPCSRRRGVRRSVNRDTRCDQGASLTSGATPPPHGMKLTWVGHATVLIELGGTTLLTDPVLGRRVFLLRRVAPPVRRDAIGPVDAVLVSHAHADHLDPRSIRRLRHATRVLAPGGAA